jgi:hypothetical protein
MAKDVIAESSSLRCSIASIRSIDGKIVAKNEDGMRRVRRKRK